ncbi:YciI family protein [Leifsonia sp. F6_8S_P_1B]|uniref:YciI family protein n=1 Tax=Leifsonia williamsii TaxID=3035919 RepID=A0ABT8K5V7_9MICO|nr:YciI family protein [Leifsonia williamsii]MDN4612845.1 YciI family protein [Leifsonia williamsii]
MTDTTNQYLLLYLTAPDGEPWSEADDDIADWLAAGEAAGALIFGERVKEMADARMVAKRSGQVAVTDGPFAEFKEWFAGFDLINAADLDAAVEIGSRHPCARYGKVLVLPLMDPVTSNELLEATIRARSAAV